MKKLLSLLLVAVLSICLLSCGNKVSSINAFSFGQEEKSSSSEIQNWIKDYTTSVRDWKDDHKLRPTQWYKINYENASYVEDEDTSFDTHVKGNGWFYITPYNFDAKYSLSFTFTTVRTIKEEDDKESVSKAVYKVEEVFIQGMTYSKIETKITFEDSKMETVNYSTNSVLMEYLSDEELWGKSIMAILDRGTIEDILNAETESPIQTFVKDNKIASYSKTNDSTQEKTLQQIVQIDGNTPFIKSLQLYTKTAHKKDGVAVNSSNSSSDETLLNYSNASVCKITITTTLLGFASRPSDYHKYL